MKKTWLIGARRGLTTGLSVIAFWNSYEHTAHWFADQGQAQAQWLALIPEAGTALVLLGLILGGLTRLQKAALVVLGAGSISVTLTGNLAGAEPGLPGTVAALVAPVAFYLAFVVEAVDLSRREPVSQVPEPVAQAEPEPLILGGSLNPVGSLRTQVLSRAEPQPTHAEPLRIVREPKAEPVDDSTSQVQALAAQGMTTAQIMAQTGLSKATVNRKKKVA